MRERLLVAGIATLIFASASACAPEDDAAPSPSYDLTTKPVIPVQATTPSAPAASPSPAAPVAQTPAPIANPALQADASVLAPAPVPADAGPAPQPAPAPASTPQGPAATGGTGAADGGAGAAPTTSFDAGSGVLQPDGKTVVYHIPDGTGGNDWNSKTDPIRVERGMTLHLIDDDKSTTAGGHWLHTYGQPCPHGTQPIGTGFDCVISQQAPLGLISGVAEHNIFNGIGHLYIEVVTE